MDIGNLNAFVAAAESGSFSLAGERLFLTQPAISKRIAALEGELDCRLFDRIGRRVLLTEAGHALLPAARRVLAELKASRQTIADLSGEVRGRLSIGTSHHIGLHRLPPVLKQFKTEYPEVELDIHFMDSEQACEAVEHGVLELAVVTLPEPAPERLLLDVIWPDPLTVVAAPEHPLAQQKSISLSALTEHAAILPGAATFTRRILQQALQARGLTLKVSMESNYLEIIKMLVSIGLGWSVLPLSMTDQELLAVAVPDLDLLRQLGSVRHRDTTPTRVAEAFMAILKQFGK